MAAPKFDENDALEFSPSFRSSFDLIQDATYIHQDELSFSQLDIASPHMPPHHYLADSEDEMEESDIEQDDYIDFQVLNNRPPSRLGRPLSPSLRKSTKISKRNGPSVDRIKMENAFLKNQNNKLAQELEQCRLTIQALKNIVGQKDIALQNVRAENQQTNLKTKVLEALLLSKHAKDGSIIIRSGGSDNNLNNLSSVTSFLQERDSLKKEIPRKPVPLASDAPITPPQSQQTPLVLQTAADASDDNDLLPPPLPPKRQNRHIRRWSMDFGPNNRLGCDDESLNFGDGNEASFDDRHTMLPPSTSVTPTSSTLTPTNDHDLQRSIPQIPRLLRRRTGDIIQSLASCRPSSTKNGYDYSPPCTPSTDSSDENESVMDEKSANRKKSARNLSRFRKIFLR